MDYRDTRAYILVPCIQEFEKKSEATFSSYLLLFALKEETQASRNHIKAFSAIDVDTSSELQNVLKIKFHWL